MVAFPCRSADCLICLLLVGSIWVDEENPDLPDPRKIIQRAITAQGGRDKLASFERAWLKTTTNIQGVTLSRESWRDLPMRQKQVIHFEQAGKKTTLIRVTNETGEWQKVNDAETVDRGPAELEKSQRMLRLSHTGYLFPLLESRGYRLTYLGEFVIDKRTTECVRVAFEGVDEMDMFFSKQSGLLVLVRSDAKNVSPQAKVTEAYYGGYKEIEGARLPTMFTAKLDGKLLYEEEITELRSVKEFPKDTFLKP